ncbi:MAG TPA: DVUA0089 family protein [Thermoleophilaceae bacterium]|nr:DVUA0089 family protein [Thermoleophilaceae bacterium]
MRQLKLRIPTALAILSLLTLAPAAGAADEDDEAGDLPATAQDLTGAGVDTINGTVADPTDIDMYRVCVDGGGTFSASSIGGGASVDTQLFLFDPSGRGVYANDDERDGVVQSLLPAGHALTPQARGEYFLAVGAYNLDPLGADEPIFGPGTGVVGPTGPGGGEPVSGWGGRPGGPGPYTLTLTGARCAPPPDTTPPIVDLRSPADGAVVNVGDPVVVDFSCADEGGSGLASCDGTVLDGGLLDTSAPGPSSVTVTARDNAGNQASVTHTVSVVSFDLTAPTIDLLAPLDGAVYLLDQKVRADYACADEAGGSGLVSCAGPVADGAFLDTGSVGPSEFTVTAADGAGNSAAATARFRVVYDFEAFLWPVRNRPRVNTWVAGRSVPIRFELDGNQGLEVIAEGWPQVAVVGCDFTAEPELGEPARHPRWFRELVYRKHKKRYVLIWSTDRRWAGSCRQFMLKLKDGTVKRADFKFVRGHRGGDDDDDDDRGRGGRDDDD